MTSTIQIVPYSYKAIAVIGDTKSIKDKLKALGGRFNPRLTCGAGWVFPRNKNEQLNEFIRSGKIKESKSSNSKKVELEDTSKFKNWLKEYSELSNNKSYYLKEYVGAIKIGEKFILLDKPSIKNRFCFHDEGVQDEFHNSLSDNKKMESYFLSENRNEFLKDINNIKEHSRAFISNNYVHHIPLCSFYTRDCRFQDTYREWDREATTEEVRLILEGLEFALSLLEKRLQTYLKRFGVSKIVTWSYWADR